MTEYHEASNVFPMIIGNDFDDLVENIRVNGLLRPIELYEGKIIDGRNRYEACLKAGVIPTIVEINLDIDPYEYVWAINAERRHLPPGQKVACKIIQLQKSATWREARLEAIREANRKRSEAAKEQHIVSNPRRGESSGIVSRDTRPENKPKTWERTQIAQAAQVSSATAARAQTLANKRPDLLEKVATGKTTLTKALKVAKKDEREEKKNAIPEITDSERCTLICSDITKAEIEPESIDIIITDPPYPQEYLSLYESLAKQAAHWLKPGGSLIVMCGQSYMPEIMALMSPHINYQWMLAYLTPGGQSVQLWQRKVNTFWKPLLWFVKGKYEGDWIGDVSRSDVNDNDKRFHDWGQSESGMADIIERFTYPGQIICDPFCGGGSTGIVSIKMNRRFIGVDIAQAHIDTTRYRIAEVIDANTSE